MFMIVFTCYLDLMGPLFLKDCICRSCLRFREAQYVSFFSYKAQLVSKSRNNKLFPFTGKICDNQNSQANYL